MKRHTGVPIRRTENSKEVTLCQQMPSTSAYIRGRVTSCTSYNSIADAAAISQFRGQAWHLDKDEDGSLAWTTPADRNAPRVRISVRRRNPGRAVANPSTSSVQ